MKKILNIIFFAIATNLYAYDLNSIDRSKPVWSDHTVTLYHHFFLMEAFRPINSGICEAENSDYENWINLSTVADPITKVIPQNYSPDSSVDIFDLGYKSNIDQKLCGLSENDYFNVVQAHQPSDEAPLEIRLYNKRGETSDLRRRIIVSEEKTNDNPYGVITHDYGVYSYLSQMGLYQASTKSTLNDDKTEATIHSMSLVDYYLLNPNLTPGTVHEMYSAHIKHTVGGDGYGTVTSYSWGQRNFALIPFGLTHGVFPNGIPDVVRTTNIAYNDEYLLYKWNITTTPTSQFFESQDSESSEVCLNRSEFWKYVPDNLGYGVYDESGDRVPDGAMIPVDYTSENIEGFGPWNGQLALQGTGLSIPYECKSVYDGTIADSDLCDNGGTYGYESFPLFDVPDGTILIDEFGDEYYVRQLKPRTTYRVVSLDNCSGLTLQDALETNDHKSFVYLEGEIPPSGAILYNAFENNTEFDPLNNGKVYEANLDDDGDGVLNFLDAFPEDSDRAKDDDYDSIADSEDEDITQATPSWNKFLDVDIFNDYDHD